MDKDPKVLLFLLFIGVHCSAANIIISEEHSPFRNHSFLFEEKSLLLLKPTNFENEFYLTDIFKQPYSSIVNALYSDSDLSIPDFSLTVSNFYFDHIVIIIDENKSLQNITNLLSENGIIWSYENQIIVVCNSNNCTDSLLSNTNLLHLFNGAVINLNENSAFRVCGSSRSTKPVDLFNSSINSILNDKCKIDLRGETIPVLLIYNPPMTEFKELTEENMKEKDHIIRNLDEVKGLEVSFLKSLESRFNFKVEIVKPKLSTSFAYVRENGGIFASYPTLTSGEVKFKGTLEPSALASFTSNVKITYPLYYERSCIIVDRWLVPRKLVNFYEIFTWDVYLAVGITSVMVAITWIVIAKYLDLHNGHYGSLIFIVIFMINNGGVYRDLHAKLEKILILSFLILNMIVLNIFQGNLMNIFNKPDDFQKYTEFHNFVELGIAILPFRRELARFFQQYKVDVSTPHKKLSQMIDKALLMTGNENDSDGYILTNYDEYIAQGMAILTTISLAERKITDDVLRRGDTSLIKVKVDNGKGKMVCFMNNQFKLWPYIDLHVMELDRANILAKWREESLNKRIYGMIMKSTTSKDNHVFDLVELQICFIAYGIGILFSSTVFMVEIVAGIIYSIFKKFRCLKR